MAGRRKTPEQVAIMRRAGRVVALMHEAVREAAVPGAPLIDLDVAARDVLDRCGATSNFLGYHGYPAVLCASPNDTVLHGVPDGTRLVEGDLLSIDCGAVIDGWHGDAAFSMVVGGDAAHPAAAALIRTVEAALAAGIAALSDGGRVGDVAQAVTRVTRGEGCDVVKHYVGHGIGREMHEEPNVPNLWPFRGPNPRLRAGMCVAVEPIITAGRA
ncbi:MAG: type I methionyl aminopeptidase, partial [Acidimicrobiales bacterium]